MPPPQLKVDRQITPPFLLRIFYCAGSYPLLSDLSQDPSSASSTVTTYAWQSTTLLELSHILVPHLTSLLPDPAISTRLSYRLIYADTRKTPTNGRASAKYNARNEPAKYLAKDLGSVVLGGDLDVSDNDDDVERLNGGSNGHSRRGSGSLTKDDRVTLSDGRFIVGDFITVAVLPPLKDGSIAPAIKDPPVARLNRPMVNVNGGAEGGTNGSMNGGGRGGRGYDMSREFGNRGRGGFDRGGGGGFGFGRGRGGNAVPFPSGEWRRGEQLPLGGGGGGARGGHKGRERW